VPFAAEREFLVYNLLPASYEPQSNADHVKQWNQNFAKKMVKYFPEILTVS
jgi:hypothetical protein